MTRSRNEGQKRWMEKRCTPVRALQSFSKAGSNCLKICRKDLDGSCLTFFACLTFCRKRTWCRFISARAEARRVLAQVRGVLHRSQRSQGRTCSSLAPIGRWSTFVDGRQQAPGGPRGRQRANDRAGAPSDRSSRAAATRGRRCPTPSQSAPLVFTLSKIVMCRLSHGRVVDRDRTQHCARESSQISCQHCRRTAAGSQGRQPPACNLPWPRRVVVPR